MSETRPLYWSVRRELWENRSIYIAPLVVTAVVLFGSCFSTLGLPRRLRAAADPAKQHATLVMPFTMAPAPIMLAALIVGLFYCLDALHGERRDRSILFWKSLPVSDMTTVASKAIIPLAVLPLIALVLGLFTQRVLMLLGTMVLAGHGMSPAPLWSELPFFQELIVMFYGLAVHALWFAPIYAYLLLVSAWARRATFLWAFVPLFAISILEKLLFNTTFFAFMLRYRVIGAMAEAFAPHERNTALIHLSQLDPLRFLTSAGLWVGLIVAAAFLAAAVRLRRYREPI
jgi:ABC-2 type transport system permease protein